MAKRRSKIRSKRPLIDQRRGSPSFVEVMSSVNRRAHEKANRRSGRRELKSVQAAISASDLDDGVETLVFLERVIRWVVGMVLLPLCWVTTWTFLSRFSHATMEQGFWQAGEFWYFAIGGLVMFGWFWSGIGERYFLYAYVLGHELTHAIFVKIFRGTVSDYHISSEGGYITTNKTNMVISLSPYFVPFWAVICAAVYALLRYFVDLAWYWDLVFYGLMGVTWTFHMVWTLWMIPRDQPDLKENGTFLSLVVIYFANLVVLAALLCAAEESPVENTRDFAREWLRHAATWSDVALRWGAQAVSELRAAAKL